MRERDRKVRAAISGMMRLSPQHHKASRLNATLCSLIIQRHNVIQHELLSELHNDVGALTPRLEKVIHTGVGVHRGVCAVVVVRRGTPAA